MSHAAAVHALTPADLETRLAALGIPVDRLIAAARIARSTWSAWRAGRTRPRPDRWSAATEAFAALVAEAEAAPASVPSEAGGADPVPLAGSSPPTGAPPTFAPIATALAGSSASPGTAAPAGPDAAAIAAADRAAALGRREMETLHLDIRADERLSALPDPVREIAGRAAHRRHKRVHRRLRRAVRAVAALPAATPAGVAAKARAVLAVRGATDDDTWWAALRRSTIRDAARLDRRGEAAAPADLGALTAEWVHSCSEHWRGNEAMDDILAARDKAEFERRKIQAGNHREVLWRIADIRSTSPDVLALKAAVVLAACRDLAELDIDIARRDGTSRGEGDIAVALSLVRDIIALHGDPVRHLVAAVTAAAEAPIAAEVAIGARAAA